MGKVDADGYKFFFSFFFCKARFEILLQILTHGLSFLSIFGAGSKCHLWLSVWDIADNKGAMPEYL